MPAYRAKPPKGSLLNRGDPVAKNMVGAWLFNEGSGLTVADSASRNSGTLTGSFPPAWLTSRYGKSLQFDATSNRHVDFGNRAAFDLSTKMTIACLFTPGTANRDDVMMAKWNSGGGPTDNSYLLYKGQDVANNKVSFLIWQSDSTPKGVLGTIPLVSNEACFAVGVADGSNLRLYINGVAEAATTAYNGTIKVNPSRNLVAGKLSTANSLYNSSGLIYGCFLFNGALTAKQIKDWSADVFRPFRRNRTNLVSFGPFSTAPKATQAYKAKPPHGSRLNRADPLSKGLVAAYRLVQPSGLTAYDAAGGKIGDSTLTGGPTWTTGPWGRCLSFDGTDDKGAAQTVFGLGATTATVFTRFFITGTSLKGSFVKVGQCVNGGANNGYCLGVGNTSVDTSGNNLVALFEGVRHVNTATAIGTGWHTAAMTLTAGVPTMYLDGKPLGTFAGTNAAAPTVQTQIGGYSETGGSTTRFFAGPLDCVLLYNRTLTAGELRAMHADPHCMFRRNQTKLVSFGPFATAPLATKAYRAKPVKGTLLDRSYPLARGLVRAYLFDERTGTLLRNAPGLSAATGTGNGSPAWANTAYGPGLVFDGTDDYVSLPAISSLSYPITVSALVRPTSLARGHVVWMAGLVAPSWTGHYLTLDSAGSVTIASPVTSNFSAAVSSATGLVAAGDWVRVTGVWASATSRKIYLNGVLRGTNTTSASPTFAAEYVGCSTQSSGPFSSSLLGQMACLKRWNRALSDTEIRADANDPFRMFRRRTIPVPLKSTTVAATTLPNLFLPSWWA